MSKTHPYQHPIALNGEEEKQYQEVIRKHGYGVKKIFMAMIKTLLDMPATLRAEDPDESIGDGKNKSAIMLNVEEE